MYNTILRTRLDIMLNVHCLSCSHLNRSRENRRRSCCFRGK